jgi:DNA invertase Pin-like site-specific DNA recombinase
MFGMLSVFAEFERAMIQERVKAGLTRARARLKADREPHSATQGRGTIACRNQGA